MMSSEGNQQTLSIRADRWGIIASTACFIHCIVTPVVLSMSAVSAHYVPSDENVHRALALVVATIGGFAIVTGYRRHRRARVLMLMICGLLLIFLAAFWGDLLPSHGVEVVATMIGSCFMIAAHFINHTFCKNCDRCGEIR
jgi:MerC mercury resistance protein